MWHCPRSEKGQRDDETRSRGVSDSHPGEIRVLEATSQKRWPEWAFRLKQKGVKEEYVRKDEWAGDTALWPSAHLASTRS